MIRASVRVLTLCAAIGALAVAVPASAATPVCKASDGYAADFGGRRTFRWKPQWLEAAKTDPALAPARQALIARADKALAGPVYSVTDKSRTPPSGDKHDYISMGPYWWPDPSKPNGEPYIRKDGEFNPERATNAFDAVRMDAFGGAVEALSLAYYLTGETKYAAKAAQLLRVWFLDPATRMNPSMAYAQGVPGRTLGRAEGVLDTYRLLPVIESIGVLAPAKVLTAAEQKGLETWFGDYVQWLRTAPTAKEERAAENNHGIWYDDQLAQYALFARQPDLAKATIAGAAKGRIDPQIEADGKMPKELARTRGLHYSYFALEPLIGLAELGPCVGVDLWGYKGPKGQSIRAALTYLSQFVGAEAAFPYQELKPQDASDEALPLYDLAAWAYDDPGLAATAELIAKKQPAARSRLTVAAYRK
ncbi:alginate lyase family protein [uncultured Caulobacter sp.]|uniref:alginate lyase family protein n=1 Tax=uncultured Caulobacter sp. TaxID=158749 RepID=UPI00262DADE6|nr:alginate lyase family protein [uncultured Caulobacter sp.]